MDTNEAVRALYEAFPYPRSLPDLGGVVEGQQTTTWSPSRLFHLFFPEGPAHDDLDILVAGCGTHMAPLLGASLPNARVTGIDISDASLAISDKHLKAHGLENIELQRLAIEQVADLERQFDFVHCHGVLHHLEDPVAGLRALGSVTRPSGALSLMVYGVHGRCGLYMLQEMCRRLALSIDASSAQKAQQLLLRLPEDHPFRIIHADRHELVAVEEVSDMLLHPRDVAYDTDGVRDLIADAGLRFHRWMVQGPYSPEVSALPAAGLHGDVAQLDPWQKAAVMELFYGTIIKHEFVATHANRPPAAEVFAGERLGDAIPRRHPDLVVAQEGEDIVLSNGAHQAPVQLRGPAAELALPLREADDRRTVLEILSATGSTDMEAGLALFRQFHLADLIVLRTRD